MKAKRNYTGIDSAFTRKHYEFLEVLTQLSIMGGQMNFYPSHNSIEQSRELMDEAVKFCQLHEFTDWEEKEFIDELEMFFNKLYVEWAEKNQFENSEPFTPKNEFDEEEIAAIQKHVADIRKSYPHIFMVFNSQNDYDTEMEHRVYSIANVTNTTFMCDLLDIDFDRFVDKEMILRTPSPVNKKATSKRLFSEYYLADTKFAAEVLHHEVIIKIL